MTRACRGDAGNRAAIRHRPRPAFRSRPAIWRAWGTTIILGTPAPRTGLWRIEHYANRADPLDDVTDLDVSPGDDDLILALAVAVALHRRAVAEGKRYNGRVRGASDRGGGTDRPGRCRSPAVAPVPARSERVADQHDQAMMGWAPGLQPDTTFLW